MSKGKAFFDPSKGGNLGDFFYSGYKPQNKAAEKIEAAKNERTKGNLLASMYQTYGMDMQSSFWYQPELQPDMWLLPKSEMETWRWVRIFYATDPYVYHITNMHATYPFSKFKITAGNDDYTKFYMQNAFNRNFNLFEFILKMGLSYNKFGEAINMGLPSKIKIKDTEMFSWKKFLLFEPETIEVRQAFFEDEPRYYLLITDEMKADIREAVKEKRNIKDAQKLLNQKEVFLNELQEDYISSIMNLTDASANRGTPPIQALLRTLIFQDKVNSMKLTAIDRFRSPIEIWKIGDLTNGIKPSQDQLKKFETYIKEAKNNPPFSLFVPPFVNYEVVGYGPEKSTFDYAADYEWTRDAILAGLGVNKSLILGEGPSMSNVEDVTYMKLFMMYKAVQDLFSDWITNHFIYPLAEKNKFTTDEGDLDLGTVEWGRDISLDRDRIDDYFDLWKEGIISTKTLMSVHKDLKYDQEEKLNKEEIGTVFDDGKRIKNRNIKPEKEEKKPEETEATPPEEVKPEEAVPEEVKPKEAAPETPATPGPEAPK